MKRALSIYAYLGPALLAPASLYLWSREYARDWRLVSAAWLIPVLWAYIVPGIGTNVLKVWEFDTRLRLGRFRPHHGFVFGSATAILAWLAHAGRAQDLLDVARAALVMGSVLGFWNLLYEIQALRSGVLRVYNQPWAEGRAEADVALDYAPWFFGGFGAVYGAGLAALEWLEARGSLSGPVFALALGLLLVLTLVLPTAGYMLQSRRRHGHWGTHPVEKPCPSDSTG
jgi:hypothetical protein